MAQGRPLSVSEYMAQELARAVDDVRRTVVEQPWYGQPVTPAPQPGMDVFGREIDRAPELQNLLEPPRERPIAYQPDDGIDL